MDTNDYKNDAALKAADAFLRKLVAELPRDRLFELFTDAVTRSVLPQFARHVAQRDGEDVVFATGSHNSEDAEQRYVLVLATGEKSDLFLDLISRVSKQGDETLGGIVAPGDDGQDAPRPWRSMN